MNTDYKDITDEKISINKNKQIYFSLFFILMFYSKMTNNNKIWLEANTEQSESNPGRSLGITNKKGEAVWKTVPIQISIHKNQFCGRVDSRSVCEFYKQPNH